MTVPGPVPLSAVCGGSGARDKIKITLRSLRTLREIMTENELSKFFLDIAFKVHTALGPGLFESASENILCYELEKNNVPFERQMEVLIRYDNKVFSNAFRADIILEKKVIIELKSVECLNDVHKKQLLTYLKLTGLKLGLLINFNEKLLKNGIVRIVNGL